MVGVLYQTENCAVMDLAVGEDRCAIWQCQGETLCESVREKSSCGEHGSEDMSFPCAALWITIEQTVGRGKVSLGRRR